ncbi:PEGA domain-containing protein [Sideroxydans sp. CL21]|uniref:PEGA domain-containing protein n=1 Tax=Sideroxydans sp. CL21 TaxID=2600596 RepID=UPI0024BCDD7E|nr:PEGA domain-containing protein [Sideroxydans sp. CL21]
MSDDIHVGEKEKVNANASKVKALASIRIAGYVDGRNVGNPRKIGINEERVFGMSGKDIVLDRDVTDVVADFLRKRLDNSGIQILGKDDANALFELSGVVKELRYDVKARDYVLIRLDTTLKEVATGKVVWAGEVEEKADRFAGVSGNTKGDIADYLKQEIGVVTDKTSEAIYTVLMATRPELFNLTPGTKVIPGVKVLVTPGVASSPEPAVPAPAAPAAGDKSHDSTSANGMLEVNTTPDRAKVYVDGIYFGMSPLRAETDPGVHKVEVKIKGYKTASEKVSIRKGESTELELTLEH